MAKDNKKPKRDKKDKKGGGGKSMDFGKTVFLFLSILGIAWWVGTVMKSEGESKYIEACHPVTLSTEYLIKVATGLTGFTPQWTLKTKEVMDGGCYYFFATFLFSDDLGEDVDDAVRKESVGGGNIMGSGRRTSVGVHR